MLKNFNSFEFIKRFIKFSPRQFKGETLAGNYIKTILKEYGFDFIIQKFTINLPFYKKQVLFVDGKSVECLANCFVSGKIEGNENIISSLWSGDCVDVPNINFNPNCFSISRADHYNAPSLSVSHKSIQKILNAKEVFGEVIVQKTKHKTENILLGNLKNPKYIVFAHYDSVQTGAIDNASGVAVTLDAVILKPEILQNTLINFSACEELSYDKIYWGYGFRVFEKKFFKQMSKAQKLIPVDSVGNGTTKIITEPDLIWLGFPIKNMKKWLKKIRFIIGDIEHLMSVYHSDIDDTRGIDKKYLDEARDSLLNEIL